MNSLYIKRYLLPKIVCAFVMVVIFALVDNTLYGWIREVLEKQNTIQREIGETKKRVSDFNLHRHGIESVLELWEDIQDGEEAKLGMQIDEAYQRLLDMKESYQIDAFRSAISTPQIIERKKVADKEVVILQSTISVQMKAFSDAAVYNLIRDVIDNFPGYLSINMLKVARISDVNDGMFTTAERFGVFPNLVDASLTLDWYDLQRIAQGDS